MRLKSRLATPLNRTSARLAIYLASMEACQVPASLRSEPPVLKLCDSFDTDNWHPTATSTSTCLLKRTHPRSSATSASWCTLRIRPASAAPTSRSKVRIWVRAVPVLLNPPLLFPLVLLCRLLVRRLWFHLRHRALENRRWPTSRVAHLLLSSTSHLPRLRPP